MKRIYSNGATETRTRTNCYYSNQLHSVFALFSDKIFPKYADISTNSTYGKIHFFAVFFVKKQRDSIPHRKKKWSHFDLKSWVTGGTKIQPRYWVSISNCLSISIQFDSNILQLLGIQGRILAPPVTQLFRSKWLHSFFQYLQVFLQAIIVRVFFLVRLTASVVRSTQIFRLFNKQYND